MSAVEPNPKSGRTQRTDAEHPSVPPIADAEVQATAGRRRTVVGLLIGLASVIAVVVALSAVVGSQLLEERERRISERVENRITLLVEDRVATVEAWVASMRERAHPLVGSEQFRQFARSNDPALDLDPETLELTRSLTPYMQDYVITPFAVQNQLHALHVLDREGSVILASRGTANALTVDQLELAQQVFAQQDMVISPAYPVGDRLVMDFALPVLAEEAARVGDDLPVVAAMLMSVEATQAITDFITPPELLLEAGQQTLIVQARSGVVETVRPTSDRLVVPVDSQISQTVDAPLPFEQRDGLVSRAPVLSFGLPVTALPWLLVQEADRGVILSEIGETRRLVIAFTGLAILVIGATLFAVWFSQKSTYNRALADQFRALAGRIDGQRRLLDGINGAIREFIGLKSRDGAYSYVNPAFAAAVGRPVEQIVGQADEAVFGHGTARRLALTDAAAIENGKASTTEEQVYLGGSLRHLQVSKVPLVRADDQSVEGIVSVFRDVTELVEERRKREAALAHTIDALVKTIELSDPYLAGHSHLTKAISVLLARQLLLSNDVVATLEVAANLSQIGKLFVPRDILTKPGRLTPEEETVMRTHVEHAGQVLHDIEFGLPVRDAIYQMYERLDGSGYPRQLVGDAIGLPARILAVADVFTARIQPRSYRAAIAPEEAAAILKQHYKGRYDERVIFALDAALKTTEGEKIIARVRQAPPQDQPAYG